MLYNPYSDCVAGIYWFPDQDSAVLLDSATAVWAMQLEAATSDEIASLWAVLCAVWSQGSGLGVEVYDVTDGLPDFAALTTLTRYPGADLYNSQAFAYGPYSGFQLVAPGDDNTYPAIANVTQVPGLAPNGVRPVSDNSFIFGLYGAGYEYAFKLDNIADALDGKWITRLRHFFNVNQYSEGGTDNAMTVRPYLMWNGSRHFGATQTVGTEQDGGYSFYQDWYVNPGTGAFWNATDLDEFDVSSLTDCGFGFLVNGSGSANVLGAIQQSNLVVEYANTDSRLVVGSVQPNFDANKQGWTELPLVNPDTGAADTLQLTAGREYLFVFRKTSGLLGLALCRTGDRSINLPGPPNWTSMVPSVDRNSLRITALRDLEPLVMGLGLELSTTGFSDDSQFYATTAPEGLDTPDAWPDINAFFTGLTAPVDEDNFILQTFVPGATDDYGYVRVNASMATGVVDAPLRVRIKDAATLTTILEVEFTADDFGGSTTRWETLGKRAALTPTLSDVEEYVFEITSSTSHQRGWLVQVANAGGANPPQGPPSGMEDVRYGGQSSPPSTFNHYRKGALYTDGLEHCTAEVNVSTIPDAPSDFDAIAAGEVCNIDFIMLTWTQPDLSGCGELASVEVQRSDDGGETWDCVANVTTDAVMFDDYESIRNAEALYRARAWRSDGTPSDFTDEVAATATLSGVGLLFTSNERPELTVFYPDVSETRDFQWPRQEQVFQPYNRDYQVVFSELEDRGTVFSSQLLVRGTRLNEEGAPCVVQCSDCESEQDYDLNGVTVFNPLKAIARADLSYVCVHNEVGNRFYSHVTVPGGQWNVAHDVWAAAVNVVETTNVASCADAGTSGSGSGSGSGS